MIITLYTEGMFSSSHYLNDYQGKCAEMHGHTWKITVWVRGDEKLKKKNGILWDFGNIKKITETLDHKVINNIMDENPTAENIALYAYKRFKAEDPELEFKIRIYENAVLKTAYCETGDF